MSRIRKYSSRYKDWKKRNDAKKLKNRIKKKKKPKNKVKAKYKYSGTPKIFCVPQVFSIIKNPEETIKFLNMLINEVEKIREITKNNSLRVSSIKNYLINMDNTIEITGDALMYLLTIIRNTRGNKLLPINWKGTFPKSEKMRKFLKNSGYLKYMQTAKENLVNTNEHIQIQTGRGYEYKEEGRIIDIRKKIIDFTCEKLEKNNTQINFLMTMLTEMITNITDHAYNENNIFENNWYIFVENSEERVMYTFMDNGLGIPTTIKKKRSEKFKQMFNLDQEYRYIDAAVKGIEKRSQTGLIERGNGLPSIYEQYVDNKINKLVIISNKAYYTSEESRDLRNSLNGTIFYWEIEKEVKV